MKHHRRITIAVGPILASALALLAPRTGLSADGAAAPAQKPPARQLTKQPQVFSKECMESTPLLYRGRQAMFLSYRPSGSKAGPKDVYLLLKDSESGRELSRFGQGHSLGSALVVGEQIDVFAADMTEKDWFHDIYRFSSSDLKNWKRELAVSRAGNEHLLNSSVCRDDHGWLMAYESDQPVQFCFKFARSKDLVRWEKIDGLVFAGVGGKEYSACPVIRYFSPYYYAIYLHAAIPGHNGWVSFVVRSQDLAAWQFSPKNPVLEAGPGEGSNNSDIDLIELNGKTYVYYATGDQATWCELKRAVYPGPMREFFESYFPDAFKVTVRADAAAQASHEK